MRADLRSLEKLIYWKGLLQSRYKGKFVTVHIIATFKSCLQQLFIATLNNITIKDEAH